MGVLFKLGQWWTMHPFLLPLSHCEQQQCPWRGNRFATGSQTFWFGNPHPEKLQQGCKLQTTFHLWQFLEIERVAAATKSQFLPLSHCEQLQCSVKNSGKLKNFPFSFLKCINIINQVLEILARKET